MIKTSFITICFSFLSLIFSGQNQKGQEIKIIRLFQKGAFPLVLEQKATPILIDTTDALVVGIAAKAVALDLELVSGIKPEIIFCPKFKGDYLIISGTIGHSTYIDQLITSGKLNISIIQNKWESFVITTIDSPMKGVKQALVVAGSDRRGTAYGLFELSRMVGISPWVWWADVVPEKSKILCVLPGTYVSGEPSVKYRGIFINDEDWGLNPWASKTFEPEEGNIGPKTYAAVFELLLRLRANFIWPAMHPGTSAFYKNPDNPKTAEDYGIVVGSSHAEPMLRNNVDEWDSKEMGDFNFFTNKENVLNYWDQRVKESKNHESIYSLGMRGIHDSGMVGASNIQEQIDALQEIITKQRNLIEKHVNPDATKVPQAFTVYKEVLDIYDAGLQIPDDITLVWPDDNYGYIQRFSDEKQQKKIGGSGIYYHISYWGRPHDYLWLSSTHPVLIWEEMIKAANFNSNEIWVVNVGDIKPLEYATTLFLDMAWDTSNFPSGQSVHNHLDQWYKNVFGEVAGGIIANVTWSYYNLNFERRPEFMGWSQTEPTCKTQFTEYNHFEAGDEAQQRVDRFDNLKQQLVLARKIVPLHLQDAFFQLAEYPVVTAGLMNKKFLLMEKAYYYAAQNRAVANDLALMSKDAYDSIVLYTDYYNNSMASGKWQNIMCMSPRSLPVFDMPPVPQWQFAKSDEWGLAVEGDEDIRRIKDINGPLNLPRFSNLTNRQYFIDVFMKGDQPVVWTAKPSSEWINVSCLSDTLSAENGKKQKRVWISIDWEKAPPSNNLKGSILFSSGKRQYSIQISAIRQNIVFSHNTHLFVEDNGYISIFAENFNRINNTGNLEWDTLEGLGYTGKSIWVNPLRVKEDSIIQDVNKLSTLEYDFYTNHGGAIKVMVFVIPVHPVNQNYSTRFAISVNNEEPQVVDHRTFGRSEEWKLNVLSNNAIITTEHILELDGKQVLKIHALDPGVIIDRIVIDCGGLVKTYSVLKETKVCN